MLPVTILAAQKLAGLLKNNNALEGAINALANSANVSVPAITSSDVTISSASTDIADKDFQLTYPRIGLYSTAVRNTQVEKFRSLSGTVSLVADLWASANLVQDTAEWIQFYVEAMTDLLRRSIGDWGDGIFFSGAYEVQFQPPKVGGFGYVESAKVTCLLNVSRN
jgi:hypothetical protein